MNTKKIRPVFFICLVIGLIILACYCVGIFIENNKPEKYRYSSVDPYDQTVLLGDVLADRRDKDDKWHSLTVWNRFSLSVANWRNNHSEIVNHAYGYHTSPLGDEYKQFQHSMLGFSIDIPKNWTFGINGTGAMTVALIYPESMDTALLTDNYESIEIGMLPFYGISLIEAYDTTMLGMQEGHPNLNIEQIAHQTKVGKFPALVFLYSWKAKNGTTVMEWVHLIKYGNQIRSVNFRAGQIKFSEQKDLYMRLLDTYSPSQPRS